MVPMEIFMRTASPMGASVRFGITVICYICYVMLGSAEQNARHGSAEASEKLGETLSPCPLIRVRDRIRCTLSRSVFPAAENLLL